MSHAQATNLLVKFRPFYAKYWVPQNPDKIFKVRQFSLSGQSAWIVRDGIEICVPTGCLMDAVLCEYPHCDQHLLHAPGECEYCDKYPFAQERRFVAGINFTGHDWPGSISCPAERLRPLSDINRWPGNTPEGYQPPNYFAVLPEPAAESGPYAWRDIFRAIIRKVLR